MQTSQFIEELASGNASGAKDILNDMLSTKAFEALEGRKIEIAQNIFNGSMSEDYDEEEYDQLDELSTKTLAGAAKAASDPDSDYHYGKSHDPQKFADHAKKTKDAKSAAAVQGAADAKGHYTRPGHTLGSYDKLAHRTPARVTSAGKASKQDVNKLKKSISLNAEVMAK
jgi:murein L,D-transpeptidase YcbB/YkuD